MDSILNSIKKLLGIPEEYTHFDQDIIIHINSVLGTLTQLGIGPVEGFSIEDESAKWTDFVPENPKLSSIKSYIYLKVRMIFDPPQSSAVSDAINKQTAEFEWRLFTTADTSET